MKNLLKSVLFLLVVTMICSSCNKTKPVVPVCASAIGCDFPTVINTVVTPDILDTLKKHGTVINSGLTPPAVNGIYFISPNYCVYDNGTQSAVGDTTYPYKYQFINQNNAAFNITVNYSNIGYGGNDSGSDNSATYISGSNNSFTIFAKTIGTSNNVPYTTLQVISGSISTGGLANYQLSTYLESKGSDPDNALVPVGTLRIFEDESNFSGSISTFSLNPVKVQKSEARAASGIGSILSTSKK